MNDIRRGKSARDREVRLLREELAACYRLLAHHRMTDLIYTHCTLRVPGPERRYLINPYGLMWDEIAASDLVLLDADGTPIGSRSPPINLAGFVIHGAIHAAREDAHCIIHTHTLAGCAVAALRDGLLTVGATVAQAFLRMFYLEKACEIQLAAQSTGQALSLPPEEICRKAERQFNAPPSPPQAHLVNDPSNLAWAALLRQLERINPGWCR